MARKRVQGHPVTEGGSRRVRVLTKRQASAGEPQPKALLFNFPKTVIRRLQPRKSIRTLIKTSVTDGLSGSDLATLPQDAAGNKVPNGVLQPGSGGYKGAVRIIKERPTSTSPPKGTKVVKSPRPLGTGRVLNPFGRRRV